MISNQVQGQMELDGMDPLESAQFLVRKRDGREVSFDASRIHEAIRKAFAADRKAGSADGLDEASAQAARDVHDEVVRRVLAREVAGELVGIEEIQDAVETALMEAGHFSVARRYIVYREERKKARMLQQDLADIDEESRIYVRLPEGGQEPLDPQRIRRQIEKAFEDAQDRVDPNPLAEEVLQAVYSGISPEEIEKTMMLTTRSRIERGTEYSYAAARILLRRIYKEVWGEVPEGDAATRELAGKRFKAAIAESASLGLLDPELLTFDLDRLGAAIDPARDRKFLYIGLQTLYDRYLQHSGDRRLETPQYFWMRVAMGLARQEKDREARAIEFYELMSTFRYVPSTPTLFNSGTRHPQLSSCYLLTVQDDLEHIFKIISDDAKLSKWAGGLGNDWTNIRATGAHIKGTNGLSQGVVPFLKVANDTAVAVNQGGKRKGAMCAYLETWHLDIEDFLDLRKNTGDERRRTHDMNTANWIPDLFMKRVREDGMWTLFNPSDVPDLHDLYGRAFEERYQAYEAMAERGEIRLFKRVEATKLWRKMLTMLFETGHPWITFKDPSNLRSPQDHVGVVHSSNLCTEILLNTSETEAAVCNLGSVNLAEHIADGALDLEKLEETVATAMRMLDNVIDINFYPTEETRNSNHKHRPVGLGIMGFQDALYQLGISYASEAAVEFADASMEAISFHAILNSTRLAAERGAYPSYPGSKWDRGLLPIDTLEVLEQERGVPVKVGRTARQDWARVREAIRTCGMRNSNCMAIAPTATISNIAGATQSIEPTYKNLYVKSNLSGDFTVCNPYLMAALKERGLWDDQMLDDLKYFDGSLQEIERVPEDLKERFATAFEIDAAWLLACAAARQKWIDMGQSLNLYLAQPSGKKLNDMYMAAWEQGLKTTYYLRALSATTVEKSTLDINRRGLQPRWMKNQSASGNIQVRRDAAPATPAAAEPEAPERLGAAAAVPSACALDNPDCEACQ